jgi:UDP-N-acetylglucosamine 2-epimerase (non-hydrolysing)
MKIKIHLISAARPNFMKIAPLYHALSDEKWAEVKIVHTGQHYDANMSASFFNDLSLPEPHFHLGVGSGTHADQTGKVMIGYEKLLFTHTPNLVVVVGDVNSTIACALATTKYIPVSDSPFVNSVDESLFDIIPSNRPVLAHLEAGLRSYDRTMPEEINRLATDVIADILWTPSPDADENLMKEGINQKRITRVGNIMIDSYEMLKHKIKEQNLAKKFSLDKPNYAVVTLHRPHNVDRLENLKILCEMLINISNSLKIVFPIHPRTKAKLQKYNLFHLLEDKENILLLDPLNYIGFMSLVSSCKFVLTDSGGVQEETTYLGIPCFTLRPNTERPITVTQGTNQLCNIDNIKSVIDKTINKKPVPYSVPELWDGHTAQRIVQDIKRIYNITS